MRRWFVHGRWPKFYVYLHAYTIVSFVLMLFSGLALYLPGWHGPLIPFLPAIYNVHILLGLVFLATLFIPLWRRLPAQKRQRILDWLLPTVLGAAVCFTGIVLWQLRLFPASWRGHGFIWHGTFTYILAGWIVIHAALKGFRPQAADRILRRELDVGRRRTIKWLGSGFALGLLGATWLDSLIASPWRLLQATLESLRKGAGNANVNGNGDVSSTPSDGYHPVGQLSGLNADGQPIQFAAFYNVAPNGKYPSMTLDAYRLRVDGLVEKPVTLSWDDFTALPSRSEVQDFQCVTGWAVPKVPWEGIQIIELAKRVKPSSGVHFVTFYSFDGVYTESLSIAEAFSQDVILAYKLAGNPLRQEQGFPVRLVVPKMYGYKSIKWVNRVEFSASRKQGYWEVRGYPDEAWYT